jgi:hypothetical protein
LISNPQKRKEQSHGGAYPAGKDYKRGEETNSPPQKTFMATPPLYSAEGWGKVQQTPVAEKIRTEASSVPSLKWKMRWSPTQRR